MIENRGINYSDKQIEQVKCSQCGNKVNQSQIRDEEEQVCIGCFHRNDSDSYNRHDSLDSQSHNQDVGENLLNDFKENTECGLTGCQQSVEVTKTVMGQQIHACQQHAQLLTEKVSQ